MSNELMSVEYKSLSGLTVTLDTETVKNTLTRGNGKVTDQEVAMFVRTCQAKALDPFENGEVYLIKYDDKAPAQLVVGCHAYVRRADHFPEYRGYRAGITVIRDMNGTKEVVQKEGACVYKAFGEKLIGGWCRVFRERTPGNIEETFVEVDLDEYSTGMSNWKSKPATMIQKVAKSQAYRAAFPNEYEGLYTIDEMQASGAIPENYKINDETGEIIEIDDPKITQKERQEMFALARECFGKDECNTILKQLVSEEGYESTNELPMSVFNRLMSKIKKLAEERKAQPVDYEELPEPPDGDTGK